MSLQDGVDLLPGWLTVLFSIGQVHAPAARNILSCA